MLCLSLVFPVPCGAALWSPHRGQTCSTGSPGKGRGSGWWGWLQWYPPPTPPHPTPSAGSGRGPGTSFPSSQRSFHSCIIAQSGCSVLQTPGTTQRPKPSAATSPLPSYGLPKRRLAPYRAQAERRCTNHEVLRTHVYLVRTSVSRLIAFCWDEIDLLECMDETSDQMLNFKK